MNNDLSDEAFYEWWGSGPFPPDDPILRIWQECRRRAEACERKAFEAGWKKRGGACYPTPRGFEFEGAWQSYKEQK